MQIISKFYPVYKKLAFKMDPEWVHESTIKLMEHFPGMGKAITPFHLKTKHNKYETNLPLFKLSFPVGLAAGLDKNAQAMKFMSYLPFGSLEVGTVTPYPQTGNPRPRLFRYMEEEALRNQMGFNNYGKLFVLNKIKEFRRRQSKTIIGVNLGKNKKTPNDLALRDYIDLYEHFAPVADYLVINISSPNTPGLRDLQSLDFVKELTRCLQPLRQKVHCPLFLKISPDLSKVQVVQLSELVQNLGWDGIVATNTMLSKQLGPGGVSGRPLSSRAAQIRKYVLDCCRGNQNFTVIGVGGMTSWDDVLEFWKQGGRWVQIYTSFIYQGPEIFNQIKDGIDLELKKRSLQNLNELFEEFENERKF